MGLDVYAGTLTRYYSNDWETFWARAAREAGMESMPIRVSGGDAHVEEKGDPEEVQRAVLIWREMVNETIFDAPGDPHLGWGESHDKPYFTDKPDWGATHP